VEYFYYFSQKELTIIKKKGPKDDYNCERLIKIIKIYQIYKRLANLCDLPKLYRRGDTGISHFSIQIHCKS
jgi:hypothetical protein